jgi:hypothetical protein
MLCSPFDEPFIDGEKALWSVVDLLDTRVPVFLSGRHHGLILRDCQRTGESLTDDIMLMSGLMKTSGLSVPRPLTTVSCYTAGFDRTPPVSSAYRQAGCFAECAWEVLRRCIDLGISTRSGLERLADGQDGAALWPLMTFPVSDVSRMPRTPGVYGFKDNCGALLYIGKAKNTRRRLGCYFRNSEDPGPKLLALRSKAASLIVHNCGSELESLILEYRLIRKHAPSLNTQVSIGERKGEFKPVQDCVILLPHADPGKGMSVWLRLEQKIAMKPFAGDFSDCDRLLEDIRTFFFGPVLPTAASDFPELEIVHRWVRRHEERLTIVPVHRLGTAEDVLEWMKNGWEDVAAFRLPR